jgi:hypothetical protein
MASFSSDKCNTEFDCEDRSDEQVRGHLLNRGQYYYYFFGDFRHVSAKNWRFFFETNVMNHFLAIFAIFRQKLAIFL